MKNAKPAAVCCVCHMKTSSPFHYRQTRQMTFKTGGARAGRTILSASAAKGKQMPETEKQKSGYAEKVQRRRAQFGVGPLMSRDGRALPWPRPIAQTVFLDFQRKQDWREHAR